MIVPKDEKNRKLADFSGFRITIESDDYVHQFFTWHCPACTCPATEPASICSCLDLCGEECPDFYTNEAANALLRRHARLQLMLGHVYKDGILQDEREYWFAGQVNPVSSRNLDIKPLAWDLDDKTAICEAALKLMEAK